MLEKKANESYVDFYGRNFEALLVRIVNLEQQVANQALEMQKLRKTEPTMVDFKSQAAAAQATEHLYAPLRSDTKPLLEMSAFVRRVAQLADSVTPGQALGTVKELGLEAREILKRST